MPHFFYIAIGFFLGAAAYSNFAATAYRYKRISRGFYILDSAYAVGALAIAYFATR